MVARKNTVIANEESRPCHNSSWATFLAGGLIVLAGWVAYSNSFHEPFVFIDDPASLSYNPTIQDLWQLSTVLSPPRDGRTVGGRPILNLSFAINYALGGTNVWGYHATNLVIHLLNGLLLLGILRRTFLLPVLRSRFGRAALLLSSTIALLWVVHPLQTESVTYTVQRAESLASLFYLLVLYAVIRGAQADRRLPWYILAIIACWLGAATKEIVVTAPVVVLLYDCTLLAGTFRQAWQRRWRLYLSLAAHWALLIGLMIQKGFVTTALQPNASPAWSCGFSQPERIWFYACSQPGIILYYLRLALWPYPLHLGWGWPVAKHWSAICWPTLIVGLLVIATIRALLRRNAGGLLGAWFFLILAPTSSIVPLGELGYEHRMYLPLAAVITWLVVSAYLIGRKWIVRGRLVIGLCLVILIAIIFGILTFQRNREYGSIKLLKQADVMRDPNNPATQNDLGNALLGDGQPLEAIQCYREALRLEPAYAEAHWNWSVALLLLKQSQESLKHLDQAIQLRPNNAGYYYNKGDILLDLQRPDEAIDCYKKAVQLQPTNADAHMHLGNTLAMLGRWPEAVEHYQQFLRIRPDYAPAHLNLAVALRRVGRLEEAFEHGLEAARQMPDNSQMLYRVAWLLATNESAKKSYCAEAMKLAQRACTLTQQKDLACLDALAAAYAAARRFDEAVATALEAQQLAQAAGQNAVAEKILMRLQLYRDRKPYREPVASPAEHTDPNERPR